MTEEEIRPIAENYVEEYCHCSDGEYTDGSLVCAGIGTALIVSRQLEKRIADLEKENAELKEELTKKADTNHSLVEQMADLESENAELKDGIALKDEEVGCVETDFNTFKSKAKEIIKELVRVEYADFTNGDYSNELSKVLEQAEQFLSEVEK